MDWLTEWLRATWEVTAEMAPYLLLGFLIAGILSIFLTSETVERHLGGTGWWTSLKATLIGIPLPLCSCGVIPVAASLRKQGAGRGAVASFLTSTPQTGVDSILATYALMGLPFTIAKVLAAFVTGFVAGITVDRTKDATTATPPAQKSCCCSSEPPAPKPEPSCCSSEKEPEAETEDCCSAQKKSSAPGKFVEALRYGLLTLPKDIGRSLVVGLVLAGLITTFIPENFFGGWLANPLISLIVVTLVAVPMYVCATGSIPLAFALMQAGLAPGAALVFLIAGPATNAVTINTVRQLLGKKAAAVYLMTLVLCAWAAGAVFALVGGNAATVADGAHEHAVGVTLGHDIAAVLLLVMLIPSLLPDRGAKSASHEH